MAFERKPSPFDDDSVLSEGFVPDELVGRDAEFDEINRVLQQFVDGEEPINAFIYGISGTGKTVSMRYKIQELQNSLARYDDVHLHVVFQNCEPLSSSYQAAIETINSHINNESHDHVREFLGVDTTELAQTGYPRGKVFGLFFELLEALSYKYTEYRDELSAAISDNPELDVTAEQLIYYDDPVAPEIEEPDVRLPPSISQNIDPDSQSTLEGIEEYLVEEYDITPPNEVRSYALVVLDEVDQLGSSDDLLYEIPRAEANNRISRVDPSIIGVSNDVAYKEQIRSKVESSLRLDEITFSKYSETELQDIIRQRLQLAYKREFIEGHEDEVVEAAAKYASEEGGDARYAVDLLHKAGLLIKDTGETEIRSEHIDEAHSELQIDRIYDTAKTLGEHELLVLAALAYYDITDQTPAVREDIDPKYQEYAFQILGEANGERQIQNYLKKMVQLGLIRRDYITGGPGENRYRYDFHNMPMELALHVLHEIGNPEDDYPLMPSEIVEVCEDNDIKPSELESA